MAAAGKKTLGTTRLQDGSVRTRNITVFQFCNSSQLNCMDTVRGFFKKALLVNHITPLAHFPVTDGNKAGIDLVLRQPFMLYL